ncbi:hypothetical protein TPHA_0E01030 [Tetrapisispora phaffii CBS 4417]|uniref:RRM domain-containing protein n=1 Tax=Tetrapisispora phaffii (strain ATCC 24235 / CBS 4417 / NBRC 1672 / NRRL Y-8282 / UCD 70-5) TaxID=1071381 RepID=G8BTG9_TETPH|nr:hypothetical protein TPHA_0E01030 [Tetrapisispora phaffii CBS 4417]CCE63197.1 hypothetical protein TPHA_0E01030 [Tetrapisispora phaffii CBS 4417]
MVIDEGTPEFAMSYSDNIVDVSLPDIGPKTSPSNNSSKVLYNDNTLPRDQDDKLANEDDDDDDVIPTAIVIKNIPFAIKKEQLLEFIEKKGLPLPYAFNYHFDNGVFRGLAFANFQSTDETTKVIDVLNGEEIGGRKLRVEYKKMLPQMERDRIEREKREKRGQLEEQHSLLNSNSHLSLQSLSRTGLNNMNSSTSLYNGNLNSQSSIQLFSTFVGSNNGNASGAGNKNNLLNTNSSTNLLNQQNQSSQYLVNQNTNSSLYGNQVNTTERFYPPLPSSTALPLPPQQLDFNDPDTLEIYSQLLLFKEREKVYYELAYPIGLSANYKRIINVLCSFLGLVTAYDVSFIIVRRKILDPGNLQSHLNMQGQADLIGSVHPLQPSSTGGSLHQSLSYTSLLQAHAATAAASNNAPVASINTPTNNKNSFNSSPAINNYAGIFGSNSSQTLSKTGSQSQLSVAQPQNNNATQTQQSSLQNLELSMQQPFIRQQNPSSSSRIPSGYSSNNNAMKQMNALLRNQTLSPANNQAQSPTSNLQRVPSFYSNNSLGNSSTLLSSQLQDPSQQPFQQLIAQNTSGSVHSNYSSQSFIDEAAQGNHFSNLNQNNNGTVNDNLEEGLSRSLSGLDL